jgi:hypothetical protein
MEAYRDAAKEKNRKQKSYDSDENYSADKLQEAYRAGNLDLLDSINRLNSFSDAFDEKFLYSRNLLQANSIDSILKARSALFVGVGRPIFRVIAELLRSSEEWVINFAPLSWVKGTVMKKTKLKNCVYQ